MPQATQEHRDRWSERDETGRQIVDDAPACRFLEAAGYRLRHDWCWTAPTPTHVPTAREADAILYLIEEWDYGGIADGDGRACPPSGIAATFEASEPDDDRTLQA